MWTWLIHDTINDRLIKLYVPVLLSICFRIFNLNVNQPIFHSIVDLCHSINWIDDCPSSPSSLLHSTIDIDNVATSH